MFQPPRLSAALREHMDIDLPTRQNLPVPRRRHRLWQLLALSVPALFHGLEGTAAAQADSSYRSQKLRLAAIHVPPLIDAWLETSGAAGGVVVLVEGDEELALCGFGQADIDLDQPVDPNTTLFQVGDLVRPMTATAALRLAEQEVLSLDADLTARPDLPMLDPQPFGSLSLEQLLLHTSGLDNRILASRARAVDDIEPLTEYLSRRLPPRVRPAGELSLPSIHGYSLAGLVLEHFNGRPFADTLDEQVFAPFGMETTTVDPRTPPAGAPATGYRRRGRRLQVVVPDYPRTIPASFMLTTAADMSRWLRIVLNGGSLDGERLLDQTSVDRLLERQVAHHPTLPGRTLAFKEGSLFSPSEIYLAARGGGFSSVMLLLPHHRIGVFAAFNSEIDFWNLAYPILDLFGSRHPHRPETTFAAAGDAVQRLTGYWQDAAVSRATAEKLLALIRQDRMVGLSDGSIRWRGRKYLPVGPGEFREQDGDLRLWVLDQTGGADLADTGHRVLERIGWYSSLPVQAVLWILFAAVFLIAGWPRSPLPQKATRLTPKDTFSPRWPMTIARLAASLHFLFIVALTLLLYGALRWTTPDLLHEIPLVVYLVLTLPLVGSALAPVAVVGTSAAWRSPLWTWKHKLGLTLLTLALVLFPLFLWSWNLLGFHI